jgi:negative regulator of flagellin synthesis FlgM
MTEKINGQTFRPADTAGARRSEAVKPAGQTQGRAADKTSSADRVDITPSGLLLSKLEEIVQAAPVVDAERVAALKEAIASGTYEIDDRRIAERLLEFERDVLA